MARVEAPLPEWQQLAVSDAQFLGRLSVAGLALPNAPHLSQPALEVVDVAAHIVQDEIDRLVAAAESIASITNGRIVGLAHSQLALTERMPVPLRILLAPAKLKGVPVETTINRLGFQCLVNTKLTLPATPAPRQLIKVKEGCFSAGMVSVVKRRPRTIQSLAAQNRYGAAVTTGRLGGFRSIILQHEAKHDAGIRAADQPYQNVRNWVACDKLPNYRLLSPVHANRWPYRCSAEQWQALSRDPDYAFFPTEELQEAFLRGQELQRSMSQR